MQRIKQLLRADKQRMKLLSIVASLNLPDCYIAAGFLRNMVWDHLHHFPSIIQSDVDVIFFDPAVVNANYCEDIESTLAQHCPETKWQVKNQAQMHLINRHSAYQSCFDAMSYWPEKETAIAARLEPGDGLVIESVFGVDSLFNKKITYNPACPREIFQQRVKQKQWIVNWPQLELVE